MKKTVFMTGLLILMAAITGCGTAENPSELSEKDDFYKETQGQGPWAGLSSEQTVNEDDSVTITVYWDGEKVSTIEKSQPADGYEVVLFKQNENSAYIAVNNTGLGGYILYGGAHSLYQLDLTTKTLTPVFESEASAFATDVSPDNKTVAIFIANEVGEIILSTYSIEDYTDGNGYTDISYIIPAEFFQAGDAVFSPDGGKLAYAASIPPVDMGFEPNTGTSLEETVVYIIDLNTGKTEEFKRVEGLVDISWESGEEPTLQ
ncbi:MAG: hypothetical protein WC653_04105 [Candidatus Gracilibacteria bacterium]